MTETETKTKDPVCGMEVDKAQTTITSSYEGKTYYFCSDSCKERFDKNPTGFLK